MITLAIEKQKFLYDHDLIDDKILGNVTTDVLMDILPEYTGGDKTTYKLNITKYAEDFWKISYSNESFNIQFTNSILVDAVFDMIVWLVKHKYIHSNSIHTNCRR